jgi:hypothetical protein
LRKSHDESRYYTTLSVVSPADPLRSQSVSPLHLPRTSGGPGTSLHPYSGKTGFQRPIIVFVPLLLKGHLRLAGRDADAGRALALNDAPEGRGSSAVSNRTRLVRGGRPCPRRIRSSRPRRPVSGGTGVTAVWRQPLPESPLESLARLALCGGTSLVRWRQVTP